MSAAPAFSADTTPDWPASDTPQQTRGVVSRWVASLASPWWIVPVVPALMAARGWPLLQGVPIDVVAMALAHLAGRRFGIAALPAIYTLAIFFVAAVPSLYAPGNWWTIPALLIAARLGYDADLRGAIVASGRPIADGVAHSRYIHPSVGAWPDGGVLGALLLVFFVSFSSLAPAFVLLGNPLAALVPLLFGILGARQVPLRALLPTLVFFSACLWLSSPIRLDDRITNDVEFMVGSWPPALLVCAAALFVGRTLARPTPVLGRSAHYVWLGSLLLLWSGAVLLLHTGLTIKLPDPLRDVSTGTSSSFLLRLTNVLLPVLVAVLCWELDDLRAKTTQWAARIGRALGLAAFVLIFVNVSTENFLPRGTVLTVDGWDTAASFLSLDLQPLLLPCVAAMIFAGWLRRNPVPIAAGADPTSATLGALLGRFWTVAAFGTPVAVAALVAALMLASPSDPLAAFRPLSPARPQPVREPSRVAEPAANNGVTTSQWTGVVGPLGVSDVGSPAAPARVPPRTPSTGESATLRDGAQPERQSAPPSRGSQPASSKADAIDDVPPPVRSKSRSGDSKESPQQQVKVKPALPDPKVEDASETMAE